MEAKWLNLIINCKFSDFAQAYTGLHDTEEIMDCIENKTKIQFTENHDYLTETDMMSLWYFSWVEMQIRKNDYYSYTVKITIETSPIDNPYNGMELECKCEDPKILLGRLYATVNRIIL